MGYCLLQARNNNLSFSGAGVLSIQFSSLDQLDGILKRLRV